MTILWPLPIINEEYRSSDTIKAIDIVYESTDHQKILLEKVLGSNHARLVDVDVADDVAAR